jgi:hypothetical protein
VLGTLSRGAGEGLKAPIMVSKLLSRTAGEGGPSPKGLVGEGGWTESYELAAYPSGF